MSGETWQDFADGYQVSTLGRVMSPLGKLLQSTICRKTGRAMISIKRNSKHSVEDLASIVAKEFLGTRPKGMHRIHIDGNRANCALANLVYGCSRPKYLKCLPMEEVDDDWRPIGDGFYISVSGFIRRPSGQITRPKHRFSIRVNGQFKLWSIQTVLKRVFSSS